MPLHTPAVLAKHLTTLDRLSGGRLDVGLGNGWAAEEYAAAGVTSTGLGRADLAGLADTGLTEIFVDPNFDPGVGSPDAPADEATSRADLLLRELAPRDLVKGRTPC